MTAIDFLPPDYHQRRLRRRAKPWQVIISSALILLVVATAAAERAERQRLRRALEEIEPAYQTAVEQQQRLAELKKRLEQAKSAAELFTYLRHPWPRTQLLAALVEPLPPEISLETLQISGQAAPNRAPIGPATSVGPDRRNAEQELAKLPPPERDLRLLREQCDPRQTVVRLAGRSTDGAALNRYLGQLAQHPLFLRAELGTIESRPLAGQPGLRFEVTLVVRPGYGQPGGPDHPPQPSDATGGSPLAQGSRP